MSTAWPLAAIFAAAGGAEVGAGLEAALSAAVARARAAWPELSVSAAAFAHYLGERATVERLDAIYVEDLYLACACAAGDERAIAAFHERHFAELASVLGKSGIEPTVADDAVQSLHAHLFVAAKDAPAKIGEYAGRGPIAGWLRVAGVRLASKVRRGEERRANVARRAAPAAGLPAVDPEFLTIQRRYGDLAGDAFRKAFACLTAEERNVLRLHFVDDLNLERIGVVLGLSRATVGRRVLAARERLLGETLRLLGEQLHATPTEVRSLLGFLRSQLEISFSDLIGEKRAG